MREKASSGCCRWKLLMLKISLIKKGGSVPQMFHGTVRKRYVGITGEILVLNKVYKARREELLAFVILRRLNVDVECEDSAKCVMNIIIK